MKKKVLAGMLAAMMVVGLTACGGSKEAASTDSQETTEATDTADDAAAEDTAKEGGIHIGCAVQTLSNQVWAQQMEEITSRAKADDGCHRHRPQRSHNAEFHQGYRSALLCVRQRSFCPQNCEACGT